MGSSLLDIVNAKIRALGDETPPIGEQDPNEYMQYFKLNCFSIEAGETEGGNGSRRHREIVNL